MEIRIESVAEYIGQIASVNPPNRVFRGQRQDWPLLPGIFRVELNGKARKKFPGWRSFGDRLLVNYIDSAFPYLSGQFQNLAMNVDSGDHRLWALAQHYGLPTHLLDWSKDPLSSLFFACADLGNEEKDSVVWEMSGIQFLPPNHELNRGNPSFPKEILQPPHFDPRIVAQSGCFSIFNVPEDWSTPLPLTESPGPKPEFRKYIIPFDFRIEIKKQLAVIGYNRQKMSPDLEGVARRIIDDVEIGMF